MTEITGYGKFIEQNRIKSGYKNQRQLADASGLSTATISRIEAEIQRPFPDTIKVLSVYLTSTSFTELMEKSGHIDDTYMTFGKLLKEYIDKSGKTLDQLSVECAKLGVTVHPTYISKLRLEKRPVPSEEIIIALARVTGGDVEELLKYANDTEYWRSRALEAENKLLELKLKLINLTNTFHMEDNNVNS